MNYAVADGVFLFWLESLHGFRQSCPLPGNHMGLKTEINFTRHVFRLTACSSEVYGVSRDQRQQMHHSSLTIVLFIEVCLINKEQKPDKKAGWSTGYIQLFYRCELIEIHLVLALFETNHLLRFFAVQSLKRCHSVSTPPEGTNILHMLTLLETHLQEMAFRLCTWV